VIYQGSFSRLDSGFPEAVQDAVYQIFIGGRAFRVHYAMGGMVERDQVGESAADIDGNGIAHLNSQRDKGEGMKDKEISLSAFILYPSSLILS
jgi:hypothetical protein